MDSADTIVIGAGIAGASVAWQLAQSASVLLLVPGFPLINAVSDMVKGYFNMGLARWGSATLLTISAAIGIILAMSVTGIWGWKV